MLAVEDARCQVAAVSMCHPSLRFPFLLLFFEDPSREGVRHWPRWKPIRRPELKFRRNLLPPVAETRKIEANILSPSFSEGSVSCWSSGLGIAARRFWKPAEWPKGAMTNRKKNASSVPTKCGATVEAHTRSSISARATLVNESAARPPGLCGHPSNAVHDFREHLRLAASGSA